MELEQQRLAAEGRESVRRLELRTERFEVVETEVDVTTERQDSFRSAIKFVPPFSDDVEQFLESFENAIKLH